MNFLKEFPDKTELLNESKPERFKNPVKVNNHIHTPYSFAAFGSVTEAAALAAKEEVKVLGINDFYVTDGHQEFISECLKHGIFPLLNIELIGISDKDRDKGVRINDPKNPGRIYLSGKGLAFPLSLSLHEKMKLEDIVEGSNSQVEEMISKLNRWMLAQGLKLQLSVEEIMQKHALKLLRERHVARSLRIALNEAAADQSAYEKILNALYKGKPAVTDREDITGTEEELRSRLLKAGSPAFVPEDENAFLPMEEIIQIIESAGGIASYPMLLDGAGSSMTEFEESKDRLMKTIAGHGIGSVELIPLRNNIEVLRDYAGYFYEKGFVVSFGTEHNTSAMNPLSVSAKDQAELDAELMMINFNGAAYQAAWHYLQSREDKNHQRAERKDMEELGKAVLQYFFDRYLLN